jgi:DNA-binding beta-propeller fold protein YncE
MLKGEQQADHAGDDSDAPGDWRGRSAWLPFGVATAQTYEFVRQWGNKPPAGYLNRPQDRAVDSSGNVFVVDTDNHRIEKFSSTGLFLTMWGSKGTGSGQFYLPRGVVPDRNGNVFMADTGNDCIQKFTNTSVFRTQWGSSGYAKGGSSTVLKELPWTAAAASSSQIRSTIASRSSRQ